MEAATFYTGIDLHKRTSALCTVDSKGNRVRESILKNHTGAFTAYFASLPGEHRAVVETTSVWYWLSDHLATLDVDLQLAHATLLRAISHAKVKTDGVDAAMLAQLRRVDMIPEAYQLEPERREQRDLMRARLRLVERRTSCTNSISSILEKYNTDEVETLPELYQLQVASHRAQADLLTSEIKTFEKALRAELKRDLSLYRLMCIPGLGEITAASILLETGPIARFPSARQYFSYCRLVPGADNSASRHRHRSGHKAGNRYLKLAYSHAALRAIQHYPEIKKFYQAKARKKHPKIARAVVAKELARIVYFLLVYDRDFDGKFKGTELARQKTPPWPRPAGPEK